MLQMQCLTCSAEFKKRWQKKYCSNKCQADFQYSLFIKRWLRTSEAPGLLISKHIKRYLIEKFGEQCSQCKWNERHTVTNRVPIEVDHIDGNADNNSPSNLRLLCPNCHALTSSFRNLNKGKGRKWRTERLKRIAKTKI